MIAHYYNEWDEYAAQWLRNLIAAGHLPAGEVDTRSIVDVEADDLRGFRQAHFFAGIGGWSLAARIAGWPEERELWSGSAPCQPFSVAGLQQGHDDPRHLWPHYYRLIAARRPHVAVGEQVAAAVGKDWLDRVFADLEGIGYACGAAVVPACAVNAPHRRDRLWFVAHSHQQRLEGRQLLRECEPQRVVGTSGMADAKGERMLPRFSDVECGTGQQQRRCMEVGEPGKHADYSGNGAWHESTTIIGHDGKARRVEPRIQLLANGVSARVGKLRAYGNAIVPQVGAEVLKAYLECEP